MKKAVLTILFVICVSFTCSGQIDSVKLYVESNINYLRYWGKLQFTPKGDSIRRTLVPNFDGRNISSKKFPYLFDYIQKYKNDSIFEIRNFVCITMERMVTNRYITMDFR